MVATLNAGMKYLLQCLGFAAGIPCPHIGQYVEGGDHNAMDGRGFFTFTSDPAHAMQFATFADALKFWQQQSKVNPVRPDGKPNRPLTAMNATVVSIEYAGRVESVAVH